VSKTVAEKIDARAGQPAPQLKTAAGRHARIFRLTLVSVMPCFYPGCFLYVLFLAASPRIILKDMYTLQFNGTPIADAALKIINLVPSDARHVFASLHTAVTLLSLLFAYKYIRRLFWIMLPFCTGLILSTVYLRHHYVVDLIAGFALGILAFIFAPRIDSWWRSTNPKLVEANADA